jgi:parallel beta-helix repeat protein
MKLSRRWLALLIIVLMATFAIPNQTKFFFSFKSHQMTKKQSLEGSVSLQTRVLLAVALFLTSFCAKAQSNGGLTNLNQSAAVNLTNVSNRVIENLLIENMGDRPGITLTDCSNVTIRRNAIKNGQRVAIDLNRCSNITIEDNYMEGLIGGIYSYGSTGGIVIRHNRFKNMTTQLARGQFVQFNAGNGAGNLIELNYGENIAGQSSPEDAINLYATNGTPTSPFTVRKNYINGGGPSPSGGGIMTGDYGGSNILVTENVVINPGQYGIAIAGGTGNKIINNVVFASQQSFTNVGIYAWGGPRIIESPTITNNRVNWTNRDGVSNPFWQSGVNNMTERDNNWNDQSVTASFPAPAGAGIRLVTTAPTPTPTPAPTPTTAPAPAPSTPGTFYRAIDLAGSALTIDGNSWAGNTGFTHNGNTFANQNVALNPATDAARATMIRSSVYSNALNLSINGVAAGSYQVYAYVWEDNNPETYSLQVQGVTALNNFNSGSAGSWRRVGPFAANVDGSGVVRITSSGGTLNLSGVELWTSGTTTAPAPAPAPTATFFRAINLNGDAVTVDGQRWDARTAGNYSHNGHTFANQNVALTPATDAARASMIRSSVYSNALNLSVTSIPVGVYQVYAYVWEDNNPETITLNIQGRAVLTNFNTGSAGSWRRVGPFVANVASDGRLNVTSAGGTLNLSGLEIWRAPSSL